MTIVIEGAPLELVACFILGLIVGRVLGSLLFLCWGDFRSWLRDAKTWVRLKWFELKESRYDYRP